MNRQSQTQMAQSARSTTLQTDGLLQRKCASCGNHTIARGQCQECNKKTLQTKLRVNEPGDVYEQEADRIAAQVMATPVDPSVSGTPLRIQRFSRQSNGQMDAAPSSVDQALASSSRPLEPMLRQDMEQHFGRDFSQVRVHSGAAAEQSARDVNANAYTMRQNIVFGTGQFEPGTQEGRRLIAHESMQVVQRSGTDRMNVDKGNEKRGLSSDYSMPTTQHDSRGTFDPGPTFEVGLAMAQSSGAKLDPAARSFMESRFGLDFNQVRVHADNRAAALASAVHAEAFTLGQDIFFAAGRYDPASHGGRELIAHELVHTVQQNGSKPQSAHRGHAPIGAGQAKPASPQSGALRLVQRQDTFVPADFIGDKKTWTENHKRIFEQFGSDSKNAELFTEVKIPGAKKEVVELDKKGIADLYKVEKGHKTTVAVIMAGDEPTFLESDRKLRRGSEKFPHKDMGAPRGLAKGETSCTNELGTGPKKVCRLDLAPQKILIGDLKPASIDESLLGQGQIDDYQYGISTTETALNTFIENNPDLAHPQGQKWHPETAPLERDIIPAGMKLGRRNTQPEVPLRFFRGKRGEAIPGVFGRQVIYKHLAIPGIWVYEWIPFFNSGFREKMRLDRFREAIDQLNTLITRIKRSEKIGQRKAAKVPRQPSAPHAPVLRSNLALPARLIQRKTPAAQGFNGPKWQEEYNDWKNKEAKDFLDSQEEKNVELIATLSEVKRHSGLPIEMPAAADKTTKDYKRLKLWHQQGGLFGRLRAALGPLFVKLHTFYEAAKEKFEALRQSKSVTDEGGSKILQSIIRVGFKAATTFFKLVIHRVTDNLKRALQRGAAVLVRDYFGDENLDRVFEAKQDFKQLVDKIEQEGEAAIGDRIKKIIGPFEGVINVIRTVKDWLGDIGKVEAAIRWGVRIIQCLTPPGVGCLKQILWFLFERAVNKLVDTVTATCWFQQNFVVPALRKFDKLKSLPDKISGFILDQVKEMLPFDKEFKEKLFPTEKISEDISNKDLECTNQISKEAIEMNKLADRYGAAKLKHLIDILEKGGAGVDRQLNLDDIKNLRGLLEKMRKGELTEEQIAKALANHTPTSGFGNPILDQFMADFKAGGGGGAGVGAGKGSGLPNVPAAKANKTFDPGRKLQRTHACVSPSLLDHLEGQNHKVTIWGEIDYARVQSVFGVPVEVLKPEEGYQKGKLYRRLQYRLKQDLVFDKFEVKDVKHFGYKAGESVPGCELHEIGPGKAAGSEP